MAGDHPPNFLGMWAILTNKVRLAPRHAGSIIDPSSAVFGDREFGSAPARWSRLADQIDRDDATTAPELETTMPKNPPPSTCSKCNKPMRFMLVKMGGRKFRCIDCDVPDPLQLPEVTKLLTGALRPPE
jgi:hypothetical protein